MNNNIEKLKNVANIIKEKISTSCRYNFKNISNEADAVKYIKDIADKYGYSAEDIKYDQNSNTISATLTKRIETITCDCYFKK